MILRQFRKRIVGNATTSITSQDCVVIQVYISVALPGSSWKFKVQDKASPVFILVPEVTLSAQGLADWKVQSYERGLLMEGGINVVTSGTTPGEVAIWIDAWVNQ